MKILSASRLLPSLVLVALSCGGPKAPAGTSGDHGGGAGGAEAADGQPVPRLRTGALALLDVPGTLAGTVLRSSVDRGMETLEIAVPHAAGNDGDYGITPGMTFAVNVPGSAAYSFVDRSPHFVDGPDGREQGLLGVWIRRPEAAAGTPVTFEIYAPSEKTEHGGARLHVSAGDPGARKSDPAMLIAWETALRERLGESMGRSRRGAWQSFAFARLRELMEAEKPPPSPAPQAPPPPRPATAKPKPGAKPAKPAPRGGKPVQPAPPPPRPAPVQVVPPAAQRPSSTGELAGLMETSTGALAVQEALQSDRPLFLGAAREKPSVPLSQLVRPKLAEHPWERMTKSLGVLPPPEPLAEATPAEFYYLHATTYDALTMLLDQADAWGTPASHAFDHDPLDYALAARYEAELGVQRGPLSRALGSKVVSELAITGSDPYVREGTDVTILFRVKDHALFGAALGAALTSHAEKHGAITASQLSLAGVPVTVSRSKDGTVRQHRATLGDLEVVSNSPAALTRVLLAAQGKRARLSDEPDFKYMLARDKGTPADVPAYMGDRFVAEVVGPQQKIAEARRQLALGELLTPGFAALLYGYLYGRSPASVDDLVAAHLFSRSELTHATGEPIEWRPGEAARSRFGTPAELVPLIDMGALDTVTASEKVSYERFAQGYENDWGTYIDPIAVRLAATKSGGHTELDIDLRELPLIDGSGYRSLQGEAGDARFDVAPLTGGARVVLALGEDSRLRRQLSESRRMFGTRNVQFDWVGDFVSVGVLDRAAVAECVLVFERYTHAPQMPNPKRPHDADYFRALARLPVYAEIGIKNLVGATVALAGLRALADEAAPGLVHWGEGKTYRDVSIVKVSVDSEKAKTELQGDIDMSVYYAVTKGALVVALSEMAIHAVIDARLDGKGPTPAADKARGSQLTLEAASDKGRAAWASLAWMLEGELLSREDGASAALAEALLRGAPDRAKDPVKARALAFAYFGAAPLTPDGGAYALGADGLFDPARGSVYAPVWPDVPVPGSPVNALMQAVMRARADLSFDDEGKDQAGKPMRSLHAHVTTQLRDPQQTEPRRE